MMKPGGHGVIWKLMIDTGVFDWLAAQGREAAIVRQIRCRRPGATSRRAGVPARLLSPALALPSGEVGSRWR